MLAGLLAGLLAGWLAGLLAGLLAGWLAGWLAYWLAGLAGQPTSERIRSGEGKVVIWGLLFNHSDCLQASYKTSGTSLRVWRTLDSRTPC